MKLTKESLRQIIKEELSTVMSEAQGRYPHIIEYLQSDGDESILKGENSKFTLRFLQELMIIMRVK